MEEDSSPPSPIRSPHHQLAATSTPRRAILLREGRVQLVKALGCERGDEEGLRKVSPVTAADCWCGKERRLRRPGGLRLAHCICCPRLGCHPGLGMSLQAAHTDVVVEDVWVGEKEKRLRGEEAAKLVLTRESTQDFRRPGNVSAKTGNVLPTSPLYSRLRMNNPG
ncbi:uncharacterized protein BDZ99DRAFT_521145 [Mytilinidion resinicola]|uniref:Uncharacterized protein n=1 Tax=Mytilinidion resinicola TaxID=574789 RepID=A0A6A6YM10_9PEZI|nr:uncharacterized protein BDZ99DRAFT_521145 [Mytilinidion resinicola]KAF2809830.1 hypothetical protein BDZ99DRAFT_521145 [Mytilinidion resinicola]